MIPWGDGIAAFRGHPVFGVGYRAFSDYSSEAKVAHNSFIHVLAEQGVVGYVPFFMMIYFTMLHLRRTINLKGKIVKTNQIYLAGLFSSMVGYLTALYFLSRQYNHVLYIMLALCTAAVMIPCRDPEIYYEVFTKPFQRDKKLGLKIALLTIPFLWITVKIGYLLGVG